MGVQNLVEKQVNAKNSSHICRINVSVADEYHVLFHSVLKFVSVAMKNNVAESRPNEESAEKMEVSLPSLPVVTEHERDLARQAQSDFEHGKYDSCLNILNKLASTRSNDPRVAHNKAGSGILPVWIQKDR